MKDTSQSVSHRCARLGDQGTYARGCVARSATHRKQIKIRVSSLCLSAPLSLSLDTHQPVVPEVAEALEAKANRGNRAQDRSHNPAACVALDRVDQACRSRSVILSARPSLGLDWAKSRANSRWDANKAVERKGNCRGKSEIHFSSPLSSTFRVESSCAVHLRWKP